jgi:hypothetical protein
MELGFVPGTNIPAVFLNSKTDWEVSGNFFDLMNGLWGPFTIDRFANFNNKKLNRYNSLYWNPGSEAIDAFSQNWLKIFMFQTYLYFDRPCHSSKNIPAMPREIRPCQTLSYIMTMQKRINEHYHQCKQKYNFKNICQNKAK